MRRRPAVTLLSAVVLAAALAGCGDDGDPVATGSGGGAGGDSTCADLDVAVISPVAVPDLDEQPEGGLEDQEDVAAQEEAAAALERLAADGPDPVAADAAALLEVSDVDEDEVTTDLVVEARAAGERLIAWAAESCEIDGTVWSCPVRSAFRTVGARIDDGGGEDLAPDRTPEDVVADSADAGERVEVSRTDDEVLFAWLDGDGLAVRSEYVTRDGGDWSSVETGECDPGEGAAFTMVGEDGPVEDEGEPAVPGPGDGGVQTSVP